MIRIVFIFLLISIRCFAQSGKIDSLISVAQKGEGTESVDALNGLAFELRNKNPDTALYYASLALQFSNAIQYDLGEAEANLATGMSQLILGKAEAAEKTLVFTLNEFQKLNAEGKQKSKRVKKDLADTYNTLGNVYYSKGSYLLALSCHQSALAIRQTIADQAGIATSHNNIALIFALQGNYSEALKNHFASLKIKEEMKNKKGMAVSYNNIGLIYKDQGKDQQALEYLDKSLRLAKEEGINNLVATCYVNMGAINMDGGKYELALKYLNRALEISKQANNLENISNALGNIGECYQRQGKYDDALKKLFVAVKIKQEIKDQLGEAAFLVNISSIYLKKDDVANAIAYGEKSLALSEKIESAKQIQDASRILVDCYQRQGNFKKALEMQSLSMLIHDSILSKANSQELMKQELKYAYDKKSFADSLGYENQKKMTELSNLEELRIEGNKRLTLYIVLFLVIVFALFTFNRFRLIKKQKTIIELQTKNLEAAHSELGEKAGQIKESIAYSKEIQNAFLKSPANSDKYFKDIVLIYHPKDIVSGDFYWYKEVGDDMYVVVGDSTGHGVPGAIISVLAIQSLEKTIRNITSNERLHELNEYMRTEFDEYYNQHALVSIGLDYSIICINKVDKKMYVSGSGATVLIKDLQNELKADKFDSINIGGSAPAIYSPYTMTYDLKEIQSVFLFTDGIVDQKSESTGKKFGSKRLKELIRSLNTKSDTTAKGKIEKEIADWMGKSEQIDDITLIGIQIHLGMKEIIKVENFLKEHSSIKRSLYMKEFNTVIDHQDLDNYLAEIRVVLEAFEMPKQISKKCYAIMVEALENGMRHASKEENYREIFHKFDVGEEFIELSFGNFISEEDIPNLKKHLDIIEKEDQDRIKEIMFIKAADGAPLSDKGGAGVGIFDMSLKAGGNIEHEIFDINSRFYYFTHIKINLWNT